MNQRFQLLWQQCRDLAAQHPKKSAGLPKLNLFAEPGFSEMSFMQRVARRTEATIDAMPVRIFPNEMIIGSFINALVYADYTTYEERRAYGDLSHTKYNRDDPSVLSDESLQDPDASLWGWGHACGGFRKILQVGYQGIARQARERLAELQAEPCPDREGIEFLEAVITCVSAVCRLADRYGDELDRLAALEADPARREELHVLAARMRKVPAYPAESFPEALQSAWFAWMTCVHYNGTDYGRLDQYLYPYYEKDLAEGKITYEEAKNWLGYFMVKFHEDYLMNPNNMGLHPAIMLGGLKADGTDGCNPVTFMFLEVEEIIRTPNPKLSLRVNEQTPQELLEIATRLLVSGANQPDFYMDRNVLQSYLDMGIPMEDAVEYAQSVCEELSLAGMSEDCTNDGIHCCLFEELMRAVRRAAAGEKADTFEDFMVLIDQELRDCLREQIDHCERQVVKLRRISPRPLHSAAIQGCIENARDILSGGAKYNHTGSVIYGLATMADSLYSINRLVYEEKRLTMQQFLDILDRNYEGEEEFRQEILNRFPKFGNGVEKVDILATRVYDICKDELSKYTNCRGGKFKLSAWASGHQYFTATPDGRREGDPIATNISPTPGRDIKGVTAALRSVTHVPMSCCPGGSMADVSMTPGCLKGETGPIILRQLLEAYGDMGGTGLQFNVANADTLRAAQKDPDSYRSLMVRVWGYNDYFTALPLERQEHILARTVQESL